MPKSTAVTRLTDEEIIDLVRQHGTVTDAERAIGAGRNCIQGQVRRRGLGDRVAEVRRKPLTGAEKSARYRAAHLDERRAADNAWYHANKNRAQASYRRWASANPEKVRELSRRKMQRDPDRYRAIARRTYQRNRVVVAERMALRYWTGSTRATGDDRLYTRILRLDPCSYCGAPCEHLDHIRALSLGGEAAWTNLTASCASCNTSKQSRELLHFLLDRLAC